MKDDFNIHNWQADYYRKNVLKEETYGGRGSDVASVYQSAVQLSAEDMQEFLEVLAMYFKDNQDTLDNFDANSVAGHLDQASWVLSRRTGN
tara:strand:+ start:1442 stop:1714 length:273 start_codon:yes stop_codon:yes gene_type:complete